jgi:hypothetical protein
VHLVVSQVNTRMAMALSGRCQTASARIAITQGAVGTGGLNVTFTVSLPRVGIYALCYSPTNGMPNSVCRHVAAFAFAPCALPIALTRPPSLPRIVCSAECVV